MLLGEGRERNVKDGMEVLCWYAVDIGYVVELEEEFTWRMNVTNCNKGIVYVL